MNTALVCQTPTESFCVPIDIQKSSWIDGQIIVQNIGSTAIRFLIQGVFNPLLLEPRLAVFVALHILKKNKLPFEFESLPAKALSKKEETKSANTYFQNIKRKNISDTRQENLDAFLLAIKFVGLQPIFNLNEHLVSSETSAAEINEYWNLKTMLMAYHPNGAQPDPNYKLILVSQ